MGIYLIEGRSTEYPIIVCKNPECHIRFVLIFVYYTKGVYEELETELMSQERVSYCPYCGMDQNTVLEEKEL
jgi:hypothetical protein